MKRLLLLALVGSIGTLARYGLSGLVQRHTGTFPWGTFSVNALGCLLFGFVWTLAERRMLISPENRVIILTGFLGTFTTFSSYAFETARQIQNAEWQAAIGNVLLNNVLGVVLIFVGFTLGGKL